MDLSTTIDAASAICYDTLRGNQHMAKQVRIRDEQHEALAADISDTGGLIPIGAAAEEAVDFYLKRRRLNALIMKAYRAPTLEEARRVLKEEIGSFLGIPEDYLFTD